MVPERVRAIRAAEAQLLADPDQLAEDFGSMGQDEVARLRIDHPLAGTVMLDGACRGADVVGHGPAQSTDACGGLRTAA